LYLSKSQNIDVDEFDGDLILMNLDTRQVLVLNESAHILWTALDVINTRGGLLALLQEAMPDTETPVLEAALDGILGTMVSGGFLRLAADGPAGTAQA
jgi:Coenzyme PQQ synthesis protein D (PqqD)